MNRKTLYIGTILLAAAMSACVGERPSIPSPVTPPDNSPRSVGVSLDGSFTRGEVTRDADKILSLGIFGYSTGTEDFDATNNAHTPNLFFNREATRADASSAWTYDPVAVWPSDLSEKNTFFAYSPYNMYKFLDGTDGEFEVPAITSGYPKLRYRVPSLVSKQIDLLYSDYSNTVNSVTTLNPYVSNINYATNSGKVKYKMKHAMLWLRFLIAAEAVVPAGSNPREESYTITEFYLSAGNIMAAAAFDIGKAAWEPDPEFSKTNDGYESATYEFDYLWDYPLKVTAGQSQPLGGTDKCMMIIPDNFETRLNQTSIAVSYTHDDGSDNPSLTEYYVPLPFPDVRLGRPGYVMTYVVKVSTRGVTIDFRDANTIAKWLEDNGYRPIDVF